jgi:hypothetical protein
MVERSTARSESFFIFILIFTTTNFGLNLQEDYRLAELLLEAGADPSVCTPSGLNAMFTAVDREDVRLVRVVSVAARLHTKGLGAAYKHSDSRDTIEGH